NLVFADDTLIKTQCHNAEDPKACIQCVKSDPQSQSADKVGIAAIKEFSDAKTNLTTAMDRLKNKDYDQTNFLVNHALQKEFDCKNKVGVLQYTLPTTVLNDMTNYEKHSEAAMRIIDRFL
ncbi:hypothetical protein Gohar_014147, partial [Gossypium harknessii]|nr:hypothetical protein [Gossypium harknessii]